MRIHPLLRALSAMPSAAARSSPIRNCDIEPEASLPDALQLASIGIVLCFRRRHDRELAGWHRAASVRSCTDVDSGGIRESICFDDAEGRCCWRTYLLPDSDFLAWERLVAVLPLRLDHRDDAGICRRVCKRLVGRMHCGQWRASALRLHALGAARGFDGGAPRLGASIVSLSAQDAAVARRIVYAEGATCDVLAEDDRIRVRQTAQRAHASIAKNLEVHA